MSTRETKLSKQDAYRLIRDNLVHKGIRIVRSDEPSHIVAEVGDWKHWLLSGAPWGDFVVDISKTDDRASAKFTFGFRKMYESYMALFLVLNLLVTLAWSALVGGFVEHLIAYGLPFGILFPIVWVTWKTREAKEEFMTEVDRFLPSV
jgi:hypothetical protein